VFVNGTLAAVLKIGAGDVYAQARDSVALFPAASSVVDEIEFWQNDLAKDPEVLCENGLDGEFDLVSGTCLLTSN